MEVFWVKEVTSLSIGLIIVRAKVRDRVRKYRLPFISKKIILEKGQQI